MSYLRKKENLDCNNCDCNNNLDLFESPFNNFFKLSSFIDDIIFNRFDTNVVKSNILENENEYEIEIISPGCDKKDFKIKIEDDILSVSYQNEKETKSENKNKYKFIEYEFSDFQKSFKLPNNILIDKISSKYENGVLKITIPKSEQKNVKEIEIK